MALFKHFAITESMGFEFRAEAFNVFNHREYAWLGGDGGSAANNSPFSSSNNTLTCYDGANYLGRRSNMHRGECLSAAGCGAQWAHPATGSEVHLLDVMM